MPEHSSPEATSGPTHPDDTRARVLLRMLHNARSRGDGDAAAHAWRQIVLAEIERVRGLVGQYRHDALPNGRIAEAEIDGVVTDVFIRLHQRVEAFKGGSVGELRNFMRTAADFACRDYVRRTVTDERRQAGSFDADREGLGALSAQVLDELATRAAAADEEADEAQAMVHAALVEVDPDKRAVLVMDQAGYTVAEIQERLGLTRDAVYQRRRRGLLQLRDAIRELAEEDGEA